MADETSNIQYQVCRGALPPSGRVLGIVRRTKPTKPRKKKGSSPMFLCTKCAENRVLKKIFFAHYPYPHRKTKCRKVFAIRTVEANPQKDSGPTMDSMAISAVRDAEPSRLRPSASRSRARFNPATSHPQASGPPPPPAKQVGSIEAS